MKKRIVIALCLVILALGTVAVIRYKPFVDKNACAGCGDCVKACPVKAIEIVEEKAEIVDSTCIDCRNCVRACNYRAVKVPE
ncbi:MAG: 4Fe-4S binding protein [Candidatus Cloacimonetes bacterium]|nr:4Fe-4S binding protein [Candidatus Cloacimonadota bacterium]